MQFPKAILALIVGLVCGVPATLGSELAPAPRPVGRPGEVVEGHTLTLSAPARLHFGRPLIVTLTCRQATPDPPHVRFDWAGPHRTVYLELTPEHGEVVPLVTELRSRRSNEEAEVASVRLWPTGPQAKGNYLAPGRYRLRVTVDGRRDPFDPIRFLGRLETVPVSIVVGPEPEWTPADTRQLLADLAHAKPRVRLRAIRRFPPTADGQLLAAAVEALRDQHSTPGEFIGDFPAPNWPVADEARHEVLPAQGRVAVGPLLSFAAKPENAAYRGTVAEVLGKIGPDERSRAFLVELADTGSYEERLKAVHSLGQVGPAAIPTLIRIARDPKQDEVIRRVAIEETVHFGTVETAGEFLREALTYQVTNHRWSAATALGTLGDRTALPDLRRHAADEKENQTVRSYALRSYVLLAKRPDARLLLRSLLGTKCKNIRGDAETWLAEIDGRDEP